MCLLALESGGDQYPWNSSTIIGLLCGASGLFCVFLIWEHHKGGTATIPLMMFRRRVVSLGCSTMFLQFGALLLLTYWLPIWFQVVKGEGPDWQRDSAGLLRYQAGQGALAGLTALPGQAFRPAC
jgi:hypothetical protein